MKRRLTPSQLRKRQLDRLGLALILFSILAFAAMLCGAAYIDAQRGISVSQSLASVGL